MGIRIQWTEIKNQITTPDVYAVSKTIKGVINLIIIEKFKEIILDENFGFGDYSAPYTSCAMCKGLIVSYGMRR